MVDEVGQYSATADVNVIRLLISNRKSMPTRVGLVDISVVYMQSGPIT